MGMADIAESLEHFLKHNPQNQIGQIETAGLNGHGSC